MNYLLDSSALFAHFFNEPGANEVRAIFHDPDASVSICVITVLELFAMLKLRQQADQFDGIWEQYRQLFDTVQMVDESVIQQAIELR
jgi:predicted nucleic acid-binding protein